MSRSLCGNVVHRCFFVDHAALTDIGKDLSLQASINRHMRTLVAIIEPDFGLLEELLAMHILDDQQIAEVRAGVNIYEQNNRLLRCFKAESDEVCQKFLAALKNTLQDHVANVIEQDRS